MKAFIESQFGCSIAGVPTTKLTICMSDYYELSIKTTLVLSKIYLKRDKSVTIHQRNIQSLAIELFKVKRNLSNYNVRHFSN